MHLSGFPFRNKHAHSLSQLVSFETIAESYDQFQTLSKVYEIQVLEHFLMFVVNDGESD